ncbi:MAG TPA: restriction endonuclease subunit S [Dermatophilaceae bacterium]|nr:restriction endonuclease subunit S [Dermatophilaceae bacterium]
MTASTKTGGREATRGIIPGRFALSVGRPPLPEPDGFRWVPLSSVARLESGHTPARGRDEYWGGEVPWIGIRDATGNHGRVIFDTEQHVTQAGLDNSSARLLPAGTVCLSRTASVGFVVTMGVPMATSQDFVNWVCGPRLNPRYLHYVLLAEQDSVRRFAHGTTHQTMYYPEAKALQILAPDRPGQDAIVEVLGALDDKIAANTRLVSTTDALATALIRSVITEKRVALASLASVVMGSSPPGESYNESGIGTVFYQGVRDFGVRYPANRVWTTQPVRMAHPRDTLVSVRAPVGRTNLASESTCIGRGLAAVRSTADRPMTLFHLLRNDPEAWGPYEAEGTVFGSINRRHLEALLLPAVDRQQSDDLEVQLAALEERIASAITESGILANTRDTLLPLLMSGRVRVKDAETTVKGVV